MFVCMKCGKPIGESKENPKANPIYQVRVGYRDDDYEKEDVFLPDEDLGYFCSDCIRKGV